MDSYFNGFLNRNSSSEEKILKTFEEIKTYCLNTQEYKNGIRKKFNLPLEYMEYINEINFNLFIENKTLIIDNYLISLQDYKQCEPLTSTGIFGECGLEKNEALVKREKLFRNFLEEILNTTSKISSQTNRIPHIHHRLWITSNSNPSEISIEILNKYLNSIDTFDKTWIHYFWCIDTRKIPKTINYIINSGKNIIINEIFNEDYGLGKNFKSKVWFWKLYNLKFFTFSSNFLRIELLNKYGGIYFDLGFEIIKDFNLYIDNFDYIFYYHKINSIIAFPDITFFAIYQNSNLFNKYLNILEKFDNLKENIKNIFFTKGGFPYLTGVFLLLSLINSEIHYKEKIIYLNDKSMFNLLQQSSWSGTCKFGNSNVLEFEKIFKINNIFKEIKGRDLLESDNILGNFIDFDKLIYDLKNNCKTTKLINNKIYDKNNIKNILTFLLKITFKSIHSNIIKDKCFIEINLFIEKCLQFNSFDIKNIGIEFLTTFDKIYFILENECDNIFIKIIYESIRNTIIFSTCYSGMLTEINLGGSIKSIEYLLLLFKDNIKECLKNKEYIKILTLKEITILVIIVQFIEDSNKYFIGFYNEDIKFNTSKEISKSILIIRDIIENNIKLFLEFLKCEKVNKVCSIDDISSIYFILIVIGQLIIDLCNYLASINLVDNFSIFNISNTSSPSNTSSSSIPPSTPIPSSTFPSNTPSSISSHQESPLKTSSNSTYKKLKPKIFGTMESKKVIIPIMPIIPIKKHKDVIINIILINSKKYLKDLSENFGKEHIYKLKTFLIDLIVILSPIIINLINDLENIKDEEEIYNRIFGLFDSIMILFPFLKE